MIRQTPLERLSKSQINLHKSNLVALSSGWFLRRSTEVYAGGEEISRAGLAVDAWRPVSVPSTVLASLVAAGVYEDPYVGLNLKAIPREPFQEPWWYRIASGLSEEETRGTVLLEFDGINYAADIWLNGQLVDRADRARGAFRRFQYDVSDLVTPGENVLAVKVTPPKPGDFSTGFVDWNPPPPDGNMGLFRPVRLRFCRGVSIEDAFVQTRLDVATLAEARLSLSAELVNRGDREVSGFLDGAIEGIHCRQEVHLPPGGHKVVTLTAEEHPQLRIADPRVWWPHDLGNPELYELELRFLVDADVSDTVTVRFGIRDVADYRTAEGHRGFKINGREVLIRGAGWTDDLLLADAPESLEAQVQYVKHMNLNCIRCEGIWGKDSTLYDLCDRYGILMMVGWSCHWEHEQYLGKPVDERYGGVTSPEDIELVGRSWRDQLLWLRNHPSIFVWAVASDKLPAPDLERRYLDVFRDCDPTRPYLASTGGVGSEQRVVCREELVSEVSGNSGVKMLGPYEYTPPVYWYTDTRRGGACGFNTETSPGAVVPTLESLKKMLPPEHLWPIDDWWDFHCGLNEFNSLDRYREALRRRYGEPNSLEGFALKAQVLNYELTRPMFEAFRVNHGRATGVIQWMLNAAWPKMYWQLYDWFLMPTGAFYGAKKACEPRQVVYNYGDGWVYLVDEPRAFVGWVLDPRVCPIDESCPRGLRTHPTSLTAEVRVYDIGSSLLLAAHMPVEARGEASKRVFRIPRLENATTTHFLSLRLLDDRDTSIADNFYWLSTQTDVLDYETKVKPWEYYTPSREYADLTLLNSLAPAEVDVTWRIEEPGRMAVELANRSDRIAFFIELLLADEGTGEPVVPIFWQDNCISLLPGETRKVAAGFHGAADRLSLLVRGWNIGAQRRVPPGP
jgi:exo-1,4-beta-D-glucosaminidase